MGILQLYYRYFLIVFIWYNIHMFSKSNINHPTFVNVPYQCQRYFTPVGSELKWSSDLLKGLRTTLAFSKTVNTPKSYVQPNTWSRRNAPSIIRIHLLTAVFFQPGTYISFHPDVGAENQKHCCCLLCCAINLEHLLQFRVVQDWIFSP